MREEGAEGGKVGHLQQKTCAARVSNEKGGGDGTKRFKGWGLRSGTGGREVNRGRGGVEE